MAKSWKVIAIITAASVVVGCLSFFAFKSNQSQLDVWKTLTKANTPDGGYCFVRQKSSSFLFCDVGFGFVNPSGTKYSYPLEIDGFHWPGARIAEKDGIIQVWRGPWKVADFNPNHSYFTNFITKYTFNETNGLSGGIGSSFFE
jgi:hypothetical protein